MNKFNEINEHIGRYRWTICALVFFATTVNYLDRSVLAQLKEALSNAGVFGIDKGDQELNYSRVVMCFQIAYAVGMLGAGRFIDKLGTKAGYAYSLIGWSIAAIGHAFGQHTWSFGFWRAALGVSEAGNFPAANKTVAEWFPRKERAFATGLYNSGANVGSIVAPLTVPYIASVWGWESAFVLTGVVGLIWLVFWYLLYASPLSKLQSRHLAQAEFDYIHSDQDEQGTEATKVSWFKLLSFRQTWSFAVGKFLTDPIWWFFLFWLPAFLTGENARKVHDFMAANPAFTGGADKVPGVITWEIAVAVVYTVATVGSIVGGWLPKKFINS
ncbi:MAG: MFS transporter, partial [Steroidobacter sp.]